MEYRVRWEIDLFANSSLDAAEQALRIQRDPESQAVSFEIEGADGRKHEVDLSKFMETGTSADYRYVMLRPTQRLPLTDESTGCDLSLAQIRIVKQMWKDGFRQVELEGKHE